MNDPGNFDWNSLPPEARQIVESIEGKSGGGSRSVARRGEGATASEQSRGGGLDGLERMMLGEDVPSQELPVEEDDRMFEAPEPEPAPIRARKPGRSMRDLIESMEGR